MASFRRRIIKGLEKKAVPAWLYSLYFKYQLRKDHKRLSAILNSDADLMDNLSEKVTQYWTGRIQDVLQCEDNLDIPRHPLAEKMVEECLIMHNGSKITPLSYYSLPVLKMLMLNKGVHEPQEEKVFQEVIRSLDARKPMVMLELGSYWSFYSMWFQLTHPEAACYMVELNRKNLFFGKENFRINQLKGTFIHAGVGKKTDAQQNITTVDTICRQQNIGFIDLLHSDIQGFELDMLHGSKEMLSNNKVGYIFISTHSNELHEACQQLLKDQYGFQTVADADLEETYSWDGVLVMKAPHYPGVEKVDISKKSKNDQFNR